MMISTVHLDRNGYVVEVFQNTKPEALDERKYPGTLMLVSGSVCPGWRWDGQRFVLPPPRIPIEAVIDERDRRINTPFPERLRAQVTSFGSRNAIRMQRYIAEVQRTAEQMVLSDPPQDYKDDRRWPTVPELEPMEAPVRVHDVPSVPTVSGPPVTVHVHAAEAKPLVIQHEDLARAPRQSEAIFARAAHADDYGLDPTDPLYADKVRLCQAIDAVEAELAGSIDERWKEGVARLAALATASVTREQFESHANQVGAYIEGQAA